MLDFAPATNDRSVADTVLDDEIFCAACGRSITRERWRIERRGAHEHTVFNPSGKLFTIQCFIEAPGVTPIGQASSEFTWFAGHRWTVSACIGCAVHIGWRFEADDIFFGLIKPRLAIYRQDRRAP